MVKIELEVDSLSDLFIALLDAERSLIKYGGKTDLESARVIQKVLSQVRHRTNVDLGLSAATIAMINKLENAIKERDIDFD